MELSMETVRTILHAVFVIPFTAGNTRQSEGSQTDIRQMDGSLSSTVTIACLTSVVFVVIGIYTSKEEVVFKNYVIVGLTCTLVSIGIVALGMISVLAYQNRSRWFVTSSRGHADWNLKGKFLWLFGLAVIFDTSLNFAANLQCIVDGHSILDYVAYLFQNIILIMFFSLQLAFLTYFRHYKIISSVRTNYGILMVLLVNLCLWFHTLVSDYSKDLQKTGNHTQDNYTELDKEPCAVNSSIATFRERIMGILIPARIEATLLSTSFLLSLWPSVRNDPMLPLQPIPELSEDENQPLLGETSRYVYVRRHPIAFFSSIFFGTSMNIILIVSTLVFVFAFRDNEQSRLEMYPIWMGILILYKLSMLVMVLLVFRIFAKCGDDSAYEQHLSVSEYLLIFCSAACASSYTLQIIAAIQYYNIGTIATAFFLTRNGLDIIGKFMQTILIVSFKNSVLRTNYRYMSLRSLYILLAVGNFLMWCGNSFVGVQLRNLDVNGFDDGGVFANDSTIRIFNRYVLSPIIIFYDFHASMDLFEMYTTAKDV